MVVINIKLMIYGDAPTLTSSYGKVADYLGRYLIKKGVTVSWAALQYGLGQPFEYAGGKVYAGDLTSFPKALQMEHPDILLHIRDNWVFTKEFFNAPYSFKPLWERYNIKQINYTPIQALPVPEAFTNTLVNEAHLTFTMTKWAVNGAVSQGVPEDKIDYLYHGVDPAIYHKESTEHHDNKRFIFIGANYDYRKNIPFLLLAFKKYIDRGHKGDQLYIHANLIGYYHLPTFLNALKLTNADVLFREEQSVKNFGVGVSENDLNKLYNWADAYITATISEGFNMPVLEAERVGLPVIMTDMPQHRELFNRFDRTHFVSSHNDYATVWAYEWHPLLSDMVDKMESVKPGIVPRDESKFTEFDWNNIADRFLKVVGERLNI